jgi:hypothetical protein
MTAHFAGVIALPCPFCGSTETTIVGGKTPYKAVQCWNIDRQASGPLDLGKSGAIAKWNERFACTSKNVEE